MAKTVRIAPPQVEASSPAARAKAEALVGTTVAERYKVEAVLIATEIGALYRAAHIHLRKRVALKVVYAGAPEAELARLEREAVAGAHVRHPNVAGATDTGVLSDGARYLSIEHVAGASLREVLQLGPFSVERTLRVASQLAGALGASHQQGIIHRNVEPRSVIVTGERGDAVRLTDFGRAKLDVTRFGNAPSSVSEEDLTGRTLVLTTTGIIEWSTAYLPPEAVLGSAMLDERSDLYSLGVLIFEMLAGRRPFDAESPSELFAEQRERPRPRVGERAPGVVVPEALERVLAKLLSIERTERYVSAAELSEALEAIDLAPARAGSGLAKARTPASRAAREPLAARMVRRLSDGAAEALYQTRRVLRRRSSWPALAALAACLIGLGLWVLLREPARPDAPRARAETPEVDEPVPAERTAAPSGSAAAPASAEPAAPRVRDAAAWRSELANAVQSESWVRAGTALAALASLEPAALSERSVAAAAVSTATALESAGGTHADAVFAVLSSNAGTEGLWLLFEIVRTRGGTKGSERAARLLGDPEVDKRAPAALRIALLLVTTPCSEKPALFQRAVAEGDERALTALRALREMDRCPRRRPNPCCFKNDERLASAIEQLDAKLAKP